MVRKSSSQEVTFKQRLEKKGEPTREGEARIPGRLMHTGLRLVSTRGKRNLHSVAGVRRIRDSHRDEVGEAGRASSARVCISLWMQKGGTEEL